MPIMTNEGWTATRVNRLTTLWAAGLSCSQIAEDIRGGITRNSVISKVRRLKLPDPVGKRMPRRGEDRKNWPRPLARGSDSKPVNRDFRATPRQPYGSADLASAPQPSRLRNGYDPALRRNPSHNILAAIAIAGTEPGLPDKLKGEKPDGTGIRLIDLDSTTCRWPKGDPGDPDFEFCGGYALEGRPYCAGHSRLAYLPKESRGRARQTEGV